MNPSEAEDWQDWVRSAGRDSAHFQQWIRDVQDEWRESGCSEHWPAAPGREPFRYWVLYETDTRPQDVCKEVVPPQYRNQGAEA